MQLLRHHNARGQTQLLCENAQKYWANRYFVQKSEISPEVYIRPVTSITWTAHSFHSFLSIALGQMSFHVASNVHQFNIYLHIVSWQAMCGQPRFLFLSGIQCSVFRSSGLFYALHMTKPISSFLDCGFQHILSCCFPYIFTSYFVLPS